MVVLEALRKKSADTARRRLKALGKVLGFELIEGWSTIRLTEEGRAFAGTAERLRSSLVGFRAELPADYDPVRAKARSTYRLLSNHAQKTRLNLQLYKKCKLSAADNLELAKASAALVKMDKLLAWYIIEYGPFPEPNRLHFEF